MAITEPLYSKRLKREVECQQMELERWQGTRIIETPPKGSESYREERLEAERASGRNFTSERRLLLPSTISILWPAGIF